MHPLLDPVSLTPPAYRPWGLGLQFVRRHMTLSETLSYDKNTYCHMTICV
jgi:hypothetical protein